jgi:hypothetical protein
VSNTANWSYANTATVKPYIGQDEWGSASYGPEYTIACTWTANEDQQRGFGGQSGAQGSERVAIHKVYTEDARPKMLDQIMLDDGRNQWEEVRNVTSYDMSFFGEIPDYLIET